MSEPQLNIRRVVLIRRIILFALWGFVVFLLISYWQGIADNLPDSPPAEIFRALKPDMSDEEIAELVTIGKERRKFWLIRVSLISGGIIVISGLVHLFISFVIFQGIHRYKGAKWHEDD